VRKLVYAMGYRYRKHRRGLPGTPDMVFSNRKQVIFVHGCFWHRHKCTLGRMPKRLAFWRTKLESNRLRDRRNLRALKGLGWKALVIWECELTDPPKVASRIRKFLDA
jgi:DNA mismatch endonuclease (patch repair protein)